MSDDGLKVQGKVFQASTRQGIASHRIDVVQGSGANASVVATGYSDATGGFAVEVPAAVVQQMLTSGGDGLALRVYDPCGALVSDTVDKARWSPANAGVPLKVPVGPEGDDPCCRSSTAAADTPSVVRGTVRYEDGAPMPGVVVRASHRAPGSSLALGLAKTDAKGAFFIRYEVPGVAGQRGPVGLILAVERVTGEVLLATGVLEDAPADLEVCLTVKGQHAPRGVEFADLTASLAAAGLTMPLRDVAPRDLDLLAMRNNLDPERLAKLAAAHRFAHRASLHGVTLDIAGLYGLLRVKPPTGFHGLVTAASGALLADLGEAIKQGALGAMNAAERAAFVEAVQRVGAKECLKDPITGAATPFGAVLTMALPDSDDRERFVGLWNERRASPAQFWSEVVSQPAFTGAVNLVEQVKFHLQLGILTGYRAPIVDALRGVSGITRFSDLARLSLPQWTAALSAANTPESWLPGDLPEGSVAERVTAWARQLKDAVEVAFPTEAVRGEIARIAASPGAPEDIAHVDGFLSNSENAGFALDDTPIDAWVAQKQAAAFGSIPEGKREDVVAHLKTMQRVYRFAPKAEHLLAHIEKGFTSADAMIQRGAAAYTAAMADVMDEAQAQKNFSNAEQTYTVSLAVSAGLQAHRATPAVVRGSDDDVHADLRALFGPMDACACEHCRSVFSPAAYFSQCLQYLRHHTHRDGAATVSGLDVLVAARPDLVKVGLCCVNSDTPMPYIDLVNEVLEAQVTPRFRPAATASPGGDNDPADGSPQPRNRFTLATPSPWTDNTDFGPTVSSGNAEALAAAPEFTWYPAWRRVARGERIYPHHLPFEQPREEARRYLGHLGVDSAEMHALFARRDPAPATQESARRLRIEERLGLMGNDWELLTQAGSHATTQHAWGVGADLGAGTPATTPATSGALFLTESGHLDQLVARAGVSFEELRHLESSRFLRERFAAPCFNDPLPCQLAAVSWTLQHHDAPAGESQALRMSFLDGFHRLLRLRARTGWSLLELDHALSMLTPDGEGTATLSALELETLGAIDALASALKLDRVRLCSLWGELDRRPRYDGTTAHAAALFLNPSVRTPVDEALRAVLDPAATTDAPHGTVLGHKEALVAALGISASELQRIVRGLFDADDVDLTRESLRVVSACATLARALQLRVDACVTLVTLSAVPVFERGNLAALRTFLDRAEALRAAGLSVADAYDLVAGERLDGSTVTPDEGTTDAFLTDLRTALQGVWQETLPASAGPDVPMGDLEALRLELDRTLRRFASLPTGGSIVASFMTDLMTPPAAGSAQDAFEAGAVKVLLPFLWINEITALLVELRDVASPMDRVRRVRERIFTMACYAGERSLGRLREVFAVLLDADMADQAMTMFTAPADFVDPLRAMVAGTLGVDPAELAFPSEGSDDTARYTRQCALGRVLVAALRALRTRKATATVAEKLAVFFKLERPYVKALAFGEGGPCVFAPPGEGIAGGAPVAQVWVNERFVMGGEPAERANRSSVRGFDRLARAVALARRVAPSRDDLPRYESGGDGQWLSLRDMPTTPLTAGTTTGFRLKCLTASLSLARLGVRLAGARWSALDAIERARPPFPLPAPAMTPPPAPPRPAIAVFYEGFAAAFSKRTGAPERMVRELLASPTAMTEMMLDGFVAFHVVTDPACPAVSMPDAVGEMHRLLDAVERMQRMGVSTADVRAWTAALPGSDDDRFTAWMVRAANLRGFLRAKYGEAGWRTAAKPIMDALRERQRDALVGWLLTGLRAETDLHVETADDLYAHYLIDVEMTPAMVTSRLRQAIASVQLFAQRALMNLERNPARKVVVTEAFLARWRWAKRYRLWEANRKVFYYPENWIEPELRRDKSPFFQELENELLQDDVTDARAEKALRRYLERLDEVGRLDVRAFYTEGEGDTEVLHVFARTVAAPHVYYYRKRVHDMFWTPWEKLDLDIPSDHLLPAMMNGRLYLFWPEFSESQDQPTRQAGTSEAREGVRHLKYRMAWSRREGDVWSAKKISKPEIRLGESASTLPELLSFSLLSETPVTIGCVGHVSSGVIGPIADASVAVATCNGDVVISNATARAEDVLWSATGLNLILGMRWSPLGGGVGDHTIQLRYRDGVSRATARTEGVPSLPYLRISSQHAPFSADDGTFFWRDSRRTYVVDPVVGHLTPAPDDTSLALDDEYKLRTRRACTRTTALPPLSSAGTSGGEKHDVTTGKGGVVMITGSGQDSNSTTPLRAVTYDDGSQSNNLIVGNYAMVLDRPADATPTGLHLHAGGMLRFSRFYHPDVCRYVATLEAQGIHGLFALRTQIPDAPDFNFDTTYHPNPEVVFHDTDATGAPVGYPDERTSFELRDAYGAYNWELFFHVPFLVACQLSKNQRFEEAQRWFHFIFNPTIGPDSNDPERESVPSPTARFWRFAPFYRAEMGLRAEEIATLIALDPHTMGPRLRAIQAEYLAQLARLEVDPFDPHTVARTRVRAYQLAVVMKYIDNLIAWGDSLFRQDSMESVQESTQLYLLAADILGPRPDTLPERNAAVKSFGQLNAMGLDETGNALVRTEQIVNALRTCWNPPTRNEAALAVLGAPTYFCVPPNDKLLGYWDTVADRLFKLRNCLDLDGNRRSLALFDPPIDPAVLVRARAMGVDLSQIVDGPVGGAHYRFLPMLQRAVEFTGDVRSLGGQLLAALEKRDAEHLANVRAVHERAMLERSRAVRQAQVEEATRGRQGLMQSKAIAEARGAYYRGLSFMNPGEAAAFTMQGTSIVLGTVAQAMTAAASGLAMIPDVYAGMTGIMPTATTHLVGGQKMHAAGVSAASVLNIVASTLQQSAGMTSTLASYQRRQEEWDHQAKLADMESAQLDQQIAAADVRVSIAEKELENHDAQVENARTVEDFMRDKFTNEELYDWMVRQVAALYFQSYRLAYDLARKAERAFQFERLAPELRFVQPGNWDSLRRGLLAGEKLHLDLRRMEHAWLEQNRRELELTKHVSLAMHCPEALVKLRRDGDCSFTLRESLFDQDHPGHYMRRIKAVSLSIPAVVGPYAGVHATLTLSNSAIRKTPVAGTAYRDGTIPATPATVAQDPRFVVLRGAVQSICTSSGQSDSGMFQLDFRDERYLPFEGAGAESEWTLRLRQGDNDFDLATLTDVIVHVQYTARDGGEALRTAAIGSLPRHREEARVFSARQHFPTAWQAFNTALTITASHVELQLEDLGDKLPSAYRGGEMLVTDFIVVPVAAAAFGGTPTFALQRPAGTTPGDTLSSLDGLPAEARGVVFDSAVARPGASPWAVVIDGGTTALAPTSAQRPEDLLILVKVRRTSAA